MSAQNDCSLLLRGDPQGINSKAYFQNCAQNRWAHLEGFREFLDACILRGGFNDEMHALSAIRGACPEAVAEVPARWKNIFPRGKWAVCHPDQVTSARNREPMCFDKGCLVILATAIACRRTAFPALHGLDPFDFITIHPGIYKLEGVETWNLLYRYFRSRMKPSERKLLADIKRTLLTCDPRDAAIATDNTADAFLSQAFAGRPMTWKNASIIAEAFNGAAEAGKDAMGKDCLPSPITVEMTDGRSDGGRFRGDKHCNQSEAPFVTLSEKDREALRKAVEQSAKAAQL
jgi:hypothetical protein